MTSAHERAVGREAQRLETRERVYDAAIAEFKRIGMNSADVASIAAAARVVRGTFYFHFPTKEHVVFELMTREEDKIAAELREAVEAAPDIKSTLKVVTRRVVDEEDHLGSVLFRDVLSIYFTATDLEMNDASRHPVAVLVVEQLEKSRERGEIYAEVNPGNSAKFFLLGLYGLLITNRDPVALRDAVLDDYLSSFCRGLAVR
ncbi:TetR/AcrR family transcriptional regulator [Mycobacterium sp. 94-17]|uniref:TetR/AcrR family transcriptional regulator n=1 Tax=Mycobacterium sp. 94-17 TaxID=2986147 RepID=UPI002D1EE2DC|nr:TetR/AcrR family transcriptional regulator [Mycobacterium sp. 94-17]MEB4212163.1 TetR/AcrR family transcriptional regulator [Mycobacterium sp. 94-17]